MKHCYYQDEIRDHVFKPPGYGVKHHTYYAGFSTDFCSKCMLKPCVVAEYHQEIYNLGYDLEIKTQSTIEDIRASIFRMVSNNLVNHLGKRYLKKMGVFGCLSSFIDRNWSEEEGSSSGSDNSENGTDSEGENEFWVNIEPTVFSCRRNSSKVLL